MAYDFPDCSQVEVIQWQEVNILLDLFDVADVESFILLLLSDFLKIKIVSYGSVDTAKLLPEHESHIKPLNAYPKIKIVCIRSNGVSD